SLRADRLNKVLTAVRYRSYVDLRIRQQSPKWEALAKHHPPGLLSSHRRMVLGQRSEEHTSELQSRGHLVCRLLLEKKKSHTASILRARKYRSTHCMGVVRIML